MRADRRITVDLRLIGNPGIGRYMTLVFPEMLRLAPRTEFRFLTPPGWAHPGFQAPNAHCSPSTVPHYSVKEQVAMPLELVRERSDLFHSPHFLLPLVRPTKSVVTIHDAIYLVDRGDLHGLAARAYYDTAFRIGARFANHVITDSEFSKREITRLAGVPAERVTVIPLAAGPEFREVTDPAVRAAVRAKYGLPDRFFLYVGIQRRRKNIPGIIEGYARFAATAEDPPHLVIAGRPDPRYVEIPKVVERHRLGDRVHFPGFVADADLPALYSLAEALVFVSLYEGFGLPVLEAMACGTPVITSNTTSLPEVAGSAARLVDPADPSAIAEAIQQIAGSAGERARLRELGFAQVARFSWTGAAEQTLAVYDRVLAGSTS